MFKETSISGQFIIFKFKNVSLSICKVMIEVAVYFVAPATFCTSYPERRSPTGHYHFLFP